MGAPADEKRKSRKLQATPEEACQNAGGTLYQMTKANGDPDGKCCDNSAAPEGTPMNVLGDEGTYKEDVHAGAVTVLETCEYNSSPGGDTCVCTSRDGIATNPQAITCSRGELDKTPSEAVARKRR